MRLANTLLLVATLAVCSVGAGCSSLIPKRVELGQDKVQRVPTPKPSEREVQRQAAKRAAEAAKHVLETAIKEDMAPVIEPARDATVLTKSVSDSLGPPLRSASPNETAAALAARLERTVAKLNERLEAFREDNDKNAGKKIEGTGWLSVPYFVWLGGAFILFGGAYMILKTIVSVAAAGNPAVGLGLSAVQLGGRGAAALASQVLKGGQLFREKLSQEEPAIRERVEKLFVSSQKEAQSPEIQAAVRQLLK